MQHDQCEAIVWERPHYIHTYRCKRRATVSHNGKALCTQHAKLEGYKPMTSPITAFKAWADVEGSCNACDRYIDERGTINHQVIVIRFGQNTNLTPEIRVCTICVKTLCPEVNRALKEQPTIRFTRRAR